MYLLDTNVISELRRRDRCCRNVQLWAAGHNEDEMFISVVSLLETKVGALRANRKDRQQGQVLHEWIERTISEFAGRILPIDTRVALQCASLHVPDPKPDRDAYIAGTALVHHLTVVTRNTRDFAGTGVQLLNPWEAA